MVCECAKRGFDREWRQGKRQRQDEREGMKAQREEGERQRGLLGEDVLVREVCE